MALISTYYIRVYNFPQNCFISQVCSYRFLNKMLFSFSCLLASMEMVSCVCRFLGLSCSTQEYVSMIHAYNCIYTFHCGLSSQKLTSVLLCSTWDSHLVSSSWLLQKRYTHSVLQIFHGGASDFSCGRRNMGQLSPCMQSGSRGH